MATSSEILAGERVSSRTLRRVEDALFFDRGDRPQKYARYLIMLTLSSIIATGGVVADSTAVVVGGMIIAPLMTPMLAVALSTVVGDGRRALRALGLALSSAAIVIAIAVIIARIAPSGAHIIGNAQIATRTAPRLVDLIIALAAGLAGAVAVMRKDVAEVLPGVAVSISLVPPLCVAGTAIAFGQPVLARGALLLFATNFFAIQLAGMAVFAIAGLPRLVLREADRRTRNVGVAIAVACTLLCAVPLGAASAAFARQVALENRAASAVARWLAQSGYESLSVHASGSVITVQITGSGQAPSTEALAKLLSTATPRPSKVRVLVLPQDVQTPLQPSQVTMPTSETTVSAPSSEVTATPGPSGPNATGSANPATGAP